MKAHEETKEETRKRILTASEKLFWHYGFAKTTMTEIAKACEMSAANIYRFYVSKEDIVSELADNIMAGMTEKIRAVLSAPDMTAAVRLETFCVEKLKHMTALCACNEKMDEAIEFIKSKRPEIIKKHEDTKRSMLAEILSEGNRSGEFQVDDVIKTADLILKATFLCRCQWVGTCPPVEEVTASASGIIKMIVKGISK